MNANTELLNFIYQNSQMGVDTVRPVSYTHLPEEYLALYEEAKENSEEVLVITLSSGLSGTVNAANVAKQMSEYDRIHIIDSDQAIITQRFLVQRAGEMREAGKTVSEIVETIEDVKKRVTVCGMLDTLTYLKKGGRIPAALAVLGNMLHIKPVIDVYKRQVQFFSTKFCKKIVEVPTKSYAYFRCIA